MKTPTFPGTAGRKRASCISCFRIATSPRRRRVHIRWLPCRPSAVFREDVVAIHRGPKEIRPDDARITVIEPGQGSAFPADKPEPRCQKTLDVAELRLIPVRVVHQTLSNHFSPLIRPKNAGNTRLNTKIPPFRSFFPRPHIPRTRPRPRTAEANVCYQPPSRSIPGIDRDETSFQTVF